MKLKKNPSFARVMYDYDGETAKEAVLQTARVCVEAGLRSERVEFGMVRAARELARDRDAEIRFILDLVKFVDAECIRLWGTIPQRERDLNGPPN